MMRLVPTLVVALVVVAGFMSGCIPRHPPHTPQPLPEVPTHKASPTDQQSEMKN
jgi:hypothetical protein